MSAHPRPWRRGSVFGDGRRVPLDRERRARFRYLLNAHRRARRLTPTAELVGTALLKRLGVDGQCDPSHATLAADVGCSVRSVGRATATMRRLGLLRWQTRLVRNRWRAEQTSSQFELVPTAPLPVAACDGQNGRQTRKVKNIATVTPQIPLPDPAEVAAARAALEARAREMEARLAMKWRAA